MMIHHYHPNNDRFELMTHDQNSTEKIWLLCRVLNGRPYHTPIRSFGFSITRKIDNGNPQPLMPTGFLPIDPCLHTCPRRDDMGRKVGMTWLLA